jgi:hypothetical protein
MCAIGCLDNGLDEFKEVLGGWRRVSFAAIEGSTDLSRRQVSVIRCSQGGCTLESGL